MGIRQGPGVLKDPKVLLCDHFDGFVWRLREQPGVQQHYGATWRFFPYWPPYWPWCPWQGPWEIIHFIKSEISAAWPSDYLVVPFKRLIPLYKPSRPFQKTQIYSPNYTIPWKDCWIDHFLGWIEAIWLEAITCKHLFWWKGSFFSQIPLLVNWHFLMPISYPCNLYFILCVSWLHSWLHVWEFCHIWSIIFCKHEPSSRFLGKCAINWMANKAMASWYAVDTSHENKHPVGVG